MDGNELEIAATVRRSARARRLSVTVHPDGRVILTAPSWAGSAAIERFMRESEEWLRRKLAYMRRFKDDVFLPRGRREYMMRKETARDLVTGLLARFNRHYDFRWNRVSIKDLKRNWGSCSERGNLNFNYKLALLPPRLAEYVVVHELCHLAEFNHSARFWALVAAAMPDHQERRRALRRYHA